MLAYLWVIVHSLDHKHLAVDPLGLVNRLGVFGRLEPWTVLVTLDVDSDRSTVLTGQWWGAKVRGLNIDLCNTIAFFFFF